MWVKTKKFIYNYTNKLLLPYNKLKTIHQQLLVVTEADVKNYLRGKKRNPYQVFLSWLLDLASFGFVTSIGVSAITSWQYGIIGFANLAVGIGTLKWAVIEFVKEFRNTK